MGVGVRQTTGKYTFSARNQVLPTAIAVGLLLTGSLAARAGEGYAITGFGGGPDDLYAYQGILYAPMGNLSESGPQVRVWSKAFRFTYQTDLPGAPDSKIEAFGTSLEVEAGWQFAFDAGRIALLGGAAWRDHTLTPDDPGSNLGDSRIGFSATLDGEIRLSDGFGVMSYANYLTGFDQYWVQLKPYMSFGGGVKAGPELVVSGGDGYQHGRAGLFFSGYEVGLGRMGRIFLGGEAGARFDLKDRNADPYAGLNAGFLF